MAVSVDGPCSGFHFFNTQVCHYVPCVTVGSVRSVWPVSVSSLVVNVVMWLDFFNSKLRTDFISQAAF